MEWELLAMQAFVFTIILLGLPLLARAKTPKEVKSAPLKGLNLPQGTVRSMLALLPGDGSRVWIRTSW